MRRAPSSASLPAWNRRTRTQPRTPWARTTAPMGTSGEGLTTSPVVVGAVLLEDLEADAAAGLGGGGGQHGADRLRGAALAADHLAEILLGDDELDHQPALLLHVLHLHLVLVIDEAAGDEGDELLELVGRLVDHELRLAGVGGGGGLARALDQRAHRLRRDRAHRPP